MRKSLAVPTALKEAIAAALPDTKVLGMVGDEAAATRIDGPGRIVVRFGDPGDPEVDLSPLAYNYDQRVPIEVVALTESALDDLLAAIGAVIEADRFLGGLCTWIDATAPESEDLPVEGGQPPRGANLVVTASYTTPHPLT